MTTPLGTAVGNAADKAIAAADSSFAKVAASDGMSLRRYFAIADDGEREVCVYKDKWWTKAGGKIHVEHQDVPGMGAFSLFTDPEGRMMGLWKAAKK